MLIKSMTRKTQSFGQLVAYLDDGASDDNNRLYYNLYARESRAVITELEANAALLRPRKNGVVLYHEIVSIKRAQALPVARQKEILLDIAERYLGERAPDCLAYGRLHEDAPHHLHCHLVISANPDGSKERHSLKKAEFRRLLVRLEAQVLLKHPELEQKIAIGNTAVRKRTSTEGELERRTKQPSDRARLAAALKVILANSPSREALDTALKAVNLELYVRGKTTGVVDLNTGRKHRLATLGLVGDLAAFETRVRTGQVIAQTELLAAAQPTADKSSDDNRAEASAPAKEADMDLLNIALQGLGVIADVTTITRDMGQPIDQHQAATKAKVAHVTSGASEQEVRARILAERQAQMEALRRGQNDNRSQGRRQT